MTEQTTQLTNTHEDIWNLIIVIFTLIVIIGWLNELVFVSFVGITGLGITMIMKSINDIRRNT